MVPPQTAVAIASLRLALSIPRSDHASRHSRAAPRRLRFGADVPRSLRSNLSVWPHKVLPGTVAYRR